VDKSLVQLGLDSLQDTMPGMEIRFLAHQAIGVSWMVAQEEGRTKGGILADEMGLGKV
jgi:SNF2 family DNA or RNA helicase